MDITSQPYRQQFNMNDATNILLVGSLVAPPSFTGAVHSHPFWELLYFYPTNGLRCTLRAKGADHTVHSEAVFLIPPDCSHQLTTGTSVGVLYQDYIGFDFSFSPSVPFSDLPFQLDLDSYDFVFLKSFFSRYRYSAHMDSASFLQIKRLNALSCVHQLISWIVNRLQDHNLDNAMDSKQMQLVSYIREYVYSHIFETINIKQLAGELYLSPNYMGSVFRSFTGMSIKQYHNSLRMDCAYQLLLSNAKSVYETADILGFNDATYFSRKFKEHFNVSPSDVTKLQGADIIKRSSEPPPKGS